MTKHSIEENLRVWDRDYAWPADGDEWTGQARHCDVPYETWKQSIVDRLIAPYARPGDTVLEIGPGHGRWTEPLARRAGRLILVDLSPNCIAHCLRRLGSRDRLETFVSNGRDLPRLASEVDLVFSYDVFVHIAPEDIAEYLRNIRPVLKPGGWAVIHHANGGNEEGWRSPVTADGFARMAAAAGLEVWQQLSRWGPGQKLGVPRFDDRVTVMRRPEEPVACSGVPVADRLPDFLCLGAQKAGTTTLGEMLRTHPEIFVSPVKEVHYFSTNSDRSREWYARHFEGSSPGQRRGELTPYYLFHPAAPARIRALIPHARLIALLRDPVERALSGYFHSVRHGLEPLSLEEALDRESERLATARLDRPGDGHESHQSHSYVSRSRYEIQLQSYFAHFPTAQIMILKAEDLFTDPAATWQRALAFLEVDPAPWTGPAPVANAGAGEAARVPAATRARLRAMLAPTYEAMAKDHGISW